MLGIAFLIFSIWILIRANAKRVIIDENSKPQIITTGGIRINDQKYKDKLKATLDAQEVDIKDNRIENIPPGIYLLSLSLEDHTTWKSEVQIKPNTITDISPYLFPTDIEVVPKSDASNIDRIFFSQNNDYAYYIISKSNIGANNGIFQLASKIHPLYLDPAHNPNPKKFLTYSQK
jgi:hypothetical protein